MILCLHIKPCRKGEYGKQTAIPSPLQFHWLKYGYSYQVTDAHLLRKQDVDKTRCHNEHSQRKYEIDKEISQD